MKKSKLIILMLPLLCACNANKEEEKVEELYLVNTITDHYEGYDVIESFEYDSKNRVTKDQFTTIDTKEDEDEYEYYYYYTKYEYYDNDELKKESVYILENDADAVVSYTNYTLNEEGLISLQENYQRMPTGNIVLQNKAEYVYDSLGRETKYTLYHTKQGTPYDEVNLYVCEISLTTYDDVNNTETVIATSYEEDGSIFSINKDVYTYSNGNVIRNDYYYGYTLDALKQYEYTVYTYSLNKISNITRYDEDDGDYYVDYTKVYTYSNSGQCVKYVKTKYNSDHEISYIECYDYEYNNNGYLTKQRLYYVDKDTQEEYDELISDYTYIKAN